jgi:hypothetical protein
VYPDAAVKHQRIGDVKAGVGPEEIDASARVEDRLFIVETHRRPAQRRIDPVPEDANRRSSRHPDEIGDFDFGLFDRALEPLALLAMKS